jgi:protein-tyrosine phosphatase/arsenate reductase
MNQSIKIFCDSLINSLNEIPEERSLILNRLAKSIHAGIQKDGNAKIIYICTHNSRRSHFGQIWAKVAASYFGIENVETFSGGTEVTAFNSNAIEALRKQGFEITKDDSNESNPIYHVNYGGKDQIRCFSKVYNDSENPTKNFIAVMTCSDAEANCPFIPNVSARIGVTYEDPKKFDGTTMQSEKYLERSEQIALESLYVFSKLKNI